MSADIEERSAITDSVATIECAIRKMIGDAATALAEEEDRAMMTDHVHEELAFLRRTVGRLMWLDSLSADDYAELWLTILPVAMMSGCYRKDGAGTPWLDRALAKAKSGQAFKIKLERAGQWPDSTYYSEPSSIEAEHKLVK